MSKVNDLLKLEKSRADLIRKMNEDIMNGHHESAGMKAAESSKILEKIFKVRLNIEQEKEAAAAKKAEKPQGKQSKDDDDEK